MPPTVARRALVAALALVGLLLFAPNGDVLSYLGLQAVAIAVLAHGIIRHRRGASRSWWLVLGAFVAWLLADAQWLLSGGLGREVPLLSVSYLLYALEYALLIAGFVGFVRGAATRRDVDAGLDVVSVLIATLFASWELILEPVFTDVAESVGDRIVNSSFAVADVVLVALVARLLLVPGARSRAVSALSLSCVLMFVADVSYAVAVDVGHYDTVSPALGVVFLASGWLLAIAGGHRSMTDVGKPGGDCGEDAVAPARMFLSLGALVLPIPVGIVSGLGADGFDVDTYLVATSLLMVVAVIRLARLQRAAERYRRQLTRREAYYRAVSQHASDGVLVLDRLGAVREASPSAAAILGVDEVVLGTDALTFVANADRPQLATAFLTALERPSAVYGNEIRLQRAGGEPAWVEIRASNLLHDDVVNGIIVNLQDISARKRAEAELAHQAFHDPLTSLANRALFQDRVAHALARLHRRTGNVVVLFCDLDGFKNVNDSLGHAAGDRLLSAVAGRIAAVVREEDTVARLGGDEFAVLLEGGDAVVRAEDIADRILRAVVEPVAVDGTWVSAGMSIGVAAAGPDALTADELLRDADTAMYSAKAAGKGRSTWFQEAMRAAVIERLALESALREAVTRDELELRLQPIVELRSGALKGFEALVRWRHPERGLLAPIAFLEVAEETGIIRDIGAWVLEHSCRVAAAWTDPTLEIRELDDPTYPARVAASVVSSGLDPHRLVLEVTETTMIEDPDGVAERLGHLKELGVRLAIDDFGTGYSALQYLRRFPIDILKIDRSFVDGVDSAELPAIVRGMIELGRSLELTLLAEGIERAVQLDGLAAGGCLLGQGYLFARPLELDDAAALIETASVLGHLPDVVPPLPVATPQPSS
jgi:diguanylate cyclase (GGDEF)-like protein/PAS domain S-box-containing protein